MRHPLTLALALVSLLSPAAFAQGSAADFARSRDLARLTSGKIKGEITQTQWIDANTLAFLMPGDAAAQPAMFMRLDATTGKVDPLFDKNTLDTFLRQALALKPEQSPRIERVEARSGRIDLLVMGPRALAASSIDAGRSWQEVSMAEAGIFQVHDLRFAPHAFRPGRRGRLSLDTGDSTALIFGNTTNAPAKLFWINGDARTQYGEIGPGETRRQHTFAGHRWEVTDAKGQVLWVVSGEPEVGVVLIGEDPGALRTKRVEPDQSPTPKAAPNAEQKAPAASVKVDNRNVMIRDEAGKEVFKTTDGTREAGYSGRVHAAHDGRFALAMWHTPEQEHKVHMVESSPADQVQPKLKTIDYLKPGDRISQEWPRLVDLAARRVMTLDTALFSNPWSIDEVHWSKDSSTAYFIYNQRGHEVVRLCAADVASG
ncbi:MAG: DPP IV N-terminal domain-containing protein, partial [Planctomycetota bacterium]|nr:DPP IV N-terminal domain-containing protein [Planctomycetota bacterium]